MANSTVSSTEPYFSDQELADAYVLNGDMTALKNLLGRYEVPLFGYCRKLMNYHEAATKDLFQDVLLLTIEQLQQGKKIAHFNAYFFQLANFKAADYFRKLRYEQAHLTELQQKREAGLQRFDADRAFNLLSYEKTDERALLKRGIDELDGLQALASQQFWLEGASYREIAERTGKPLSNVKSALQQGKIKLKAWLLRHYNKE